MTALRNANHHGLTAIPPLRHDSGFSDSISAPEPHMDTNSVCDKCQGLLVQPEEPIYVGDNKSIRTNASGEIVEDRRIVAYNLSTVRKSTIDGCAICTLLLDVNHTFEEDSFHVELRKRSYEKERLELAVYHDGQYRYHTIYLEPKLPLSEGVGIKLDPEKDSYGRSSLPVVPLSTNLSANTQNDACLDVFQNWLDQCCTEHASCNSASPVDNLDRREMILPTRLIYTGVNGPPRLVTKDEISASTINFGYTTLSHRWDEANSLNLLNSNITNMRKQINEEDLPAVFRDALRLTNRLGVPYIWIDALCIIQDSEEDWDQEAGLMGHIYENAVCNLAATAAADEVASHHENLIRETGQSKTGLYTNRRITSMFPPLVTVVRSDFPAQQFFAITSKMRADLHEENLLKRGWVLQERLLSPRTVYFGEQLIWECAELLACETFPHGVPTRAIERDFHQGYPQRIRTIMNGSENNLSIYKPSRSEKKIRLGDKERLYLRWFYLVRRYAALDLTYQSDRLPALSGLAKKFQEMLQENYLAGLWRMYILPGLLWRSESLKEVSKEYIGHAPSWSWASSRRITFVAIEREYIRTSTIYTASVLDAAVTLATSDPTGKVSKGYIKLLGHMRPSHPRTSIRQQNEYDSYECYDDHTLYDDEGRMQCGGNFHFVIGYTSKYGAVVFGLILRPTETEGEFRRVGSFMYPYGKELKRTKPARFDVFPDFADFVPECCERRIVMIV